jgi:hypothetical protein
MMSCISMVLPAGAASEGASLRSIPCCSPRIIITNGSLAVAEVHFPPAPLPERCLPEPLASPSGIASPDAPRFTQVFRRAPFFPGAHFNPTWGEPFFGRMPFAAATPSTPGLDGAVMRERKSNNQGRRRASPGMLLLLMMMMDDDGDDDDDDDDILNQSAKEETSTSAAHCHQ